MGPKPLKCVDQEKHDNCFCKHENTLKSMEFSVSDEQLCLLTVCPMCNKADLVWGTFLS